MILAAVSDGATVCFVLCGIVAGLFMGLAVREQAQPDEEERRPDYAALNAAATKAYAGVNRDLAEHRSLTIEHARDRMIGTRLNHWLPEGMMVVTCNDVDRPLFLDSASFTEFAGVSPERLRELLMAQ